MQWHGYFPCLMISTWNSNYKGRLLKRKLVFFHSQILLFLSWGFPNFNVLLLTSWKSGLMWLLLYLINRTLSTCTSSSRGQMSYLWSGTPVLQRDRRFTTSWVPRFGFWKALWALWIASFIQSLEWAAIMLLHLYLSSASAQASYSENSHMVSWPGSGFCTYHPACPHWETLGTLNPHGQPKI